MNANYWCTQAWFRDLFLGFFKEPGPLQNYLWFEAVKWLVACGNHWFRNYFILIGHPISQIMGKESEENGRTLLTYSIHIYIYTHTPWPNLGTLELKKRRKMRIKKRLSETVRKSIRTSDKAFTFFVMLSSWVEKDGEERKRGREGKR